MNPRGDHTSSNQKDTFIYYNGKRLDIIYESNDNEKRIFSPFCDDMDNILDKTDNENTGAPDTGAAEDTGLAQERKEDEKSHPNIQRVACPSCSEIYEVNIPGTGEERSITICPFCDQKFFIRHERTREKAPQERETGGTPPEVPSGPQPQFDQETDLPPSQAKAGPGEHEMVSLATPTRLRASTLSQGSSKFRDSPSVVGLKAAVFCFLKRVPLIVIPILGVLYLITLGVYDAGRMGARNYIKKNGGSARGAFEIGLLFGLLFATILVLLIYLIFSLFTPTVFFAFYEITIFVFIYLAASFFSALGSRAAATE